MMNLACPECRTILMKNGDALKCASCRKDYLIRDGIPDFRERDEYWCNVSREKMKLLNKRAEESGDWLGAAKEIVPQYMEHFVGFNRADAQFIWPIDKSARVLDAGSMWGGLTIPAAQYSKEVFAIDKTVETLSFLDIRAKQMGFNNIYPVASTLDKLPFVDNYFDLVLLNGVLEWVAFEEDLILEKHWNGRLKDARKYAKGPTQMQIDVLKEIQRVTKPGGHIFLAIENRTGYQYLTGYPDDHVNLPFVTFLPRFIADIITRVLRGHSYRTYVYSQKGCRNILSRSGYGQMKFYSAFPHYVQPDRVIPFGILKFFKKLAVSGGGKRANLFFKFIPRSLVSFFTPSMIIIAKKGSGAIGVPRIIELIKNVNILKEEDAADLDAVIMSKRSEAGVPVKCIVYDKRKKKPLFFCKINRARSKAGLLSSEAENLRYINRLVAGTKISDNIPKLLHYGEVDGITVLITNYMDYPAFDFGRVTKKNLVMLDKVVRSSIDLLAELQERTFLGSIGIGESLLKEIERQKDIMADKMDEATRLNIDRLLDSMRMLKEIEVKRCAEHGDFDFYSNILYKDGKVSLVDFERLKKDGLPFFDLVTLITHPFLFGYRSKKDRGSITDFLKETGAIRLMKEWLDYYSSISGMDKTLTYNAIKIVLLEHGTRDYPEHWPGDRYPLNDVNVLRELSAIDFSQKIG